MAMMHPYWSGPFSPLPDPPLSSPAQRCGAGEMAVGTQAVDVSFRLTGELQQVNSRL